MVLDHKYGIRVPQTVTEAYLIDKENGNTFWRDSIKKEMDNVAVAFELLPEGDEPSPMHKHINCKLIFDVKMDFTRESRLMAQGFMATTPSKCTYAGVVSRESVRIAFTYAALHDLPVWAADIKNAYLTAPCSE